MAVANQNSLFDGALLAWEFAEIKRVAGGEVTAFCDWWEFWSTIYVVRL